MFTLIAIVGVVAVVAAKMDPDSVNDDAMREDCHNNPGTNPVANTIVKLFLL
jgi:hypothetical protein